MEGYNVPRISRPIVSGIVAFPYGNLVNVSGRVELICPALQRKCFYMFLNGEIFALCLQWR